MEQETRFRVAEVAAQQGIYEIKELSEKAGLQPSTVANIWRNRTKRLDLKTLDRLSRALSCTSPELIEQADIKPAAKPIDPLLSGNLSHTKPGPGGEFADDHPRASHHGKSRATASGIHPSVAGAV